VPQGEFPHEVILGGQRVVVTKQVDLAGLGCSLVALIRPVGVAHREQPKCWEIVGNG
jgi:hypothetical protein